MASPHVTKKIQAALTRQYRQLNPAQLRRDILALSDQLLQLTRAKRQPARSTARPAAAGQPAGIMTRPAQELFSPQPSGHPLMRQRRPPAGNLT